MTDKFGELANRKTLNCINSIIIRRAKVEILEIY